MISYNSKIALLLSRSLANNFQGVTKSEERLSTGRRINRASDDAAGLAVSSGLAASQRVYSQAYRNINDGISALSIAEGGVDQLKTLLYRLKELATESANGSFSRSQRLSLDNEAFQLQREYNRLVASTKFNNLGLLDGGLSNLRIQMGFGSNEGVGVGLGQALSRNAGTGSYNSRASYALNSSNPYLITSADFTGDGIADIVTATDYAGHIEISVGNSNGTYTSTFETDTENLYLTSIAAADLNGDGRMDVVAGTNDGAGTSTVEILYGDGQGGVSSQIYFSGNASDLTVADLNGDGRTDLITTGSLYNTVYLQQANGTLSAGTSYYGGSSRVAAGDFNGDGKIDIASVSGAFLYLFQGTGQGTLMPAISYSTGGVVHTSLAVGDYNHDGITDLIASNSGVASLYAGQSNGTFATRSTFTLLSNASNIKLGDTNGDGNLDIIAIQSNSVATYFGNGDGTFTSALSASTIGIGADFILLDSNRDGALDVVATGSSSVNVYTARTTASNSIGRLDLTSTSQARDALTTIDTILQRVLTESGNIGASSSRLQTALEEVRSRAFNYGVAVSNITDIDMAQEVAEYTRLNILKDTSSSLFGQANQHSEIVLDLLSNLR